MLIYCYPWPYSHLPARHQHYQNEENMSEACLQNYEVLVIMYDQI